VRARRKACKEQVAGGGAGGETFWGKNNFRKAEKGTACSRHWGIVGKGKYIPERERFV